MSSQKIDEMNLKLSYHLYTSIKVFASLDQFKNELIGNINNNNIKCQKIILIDKNWFNNYKKYYLYNELFELIRQNNLSLFDPEEQKILFNNIFNSFIKQNKTEKLIIFYNGKD